MKKTTKLPCVAPRCVFHVGSLDAKDKGLRGDSLEGPGLSVSLHPQEWTAIAKLGGYPTWSLRRKGGRFIDAHGLSEAQRKAVEAWGLSTGLVRSATAWRLTSYDEDGEPRYSLFQTESQARAEVDEFENAPESGDPVTATTALQATESFTRRCGFQPDLLCVFDILLTFYVEDATPFDGVWWDDLLDPAGLSAPRGVIAPSRVTSWHVSKERDA